MNDYDLIRLEDYENMIATGEMYFKTIALLSIYLSDCRHTIESYRSENNPMLDIILRWQYVQNTIEHIIHRSN